MCKARKFAAAALAGLLVGGTGIYVWTHYFQFRSLSDEKWEPDSGDSSYAGSVSCRECHERFYELWSTSHHGLAMQPVTPSLVETEILPLASPIRIGEADFSVDLAEREIIEDGPAGRRSYPMVHAMGGKNVYFFLTPLERGRLQVMPLLYDIRRKKWFDTTRSMVRHFSEEEDEAIDWRDPLLTFNTACYNCHVSQLDKNYDPATDSYRTTWREPGINCEACHGPSEEHNRVCRAVPRGTVPKSIRIMSWRDFTIDQVNDACSPCHAKMRSIKPGFKPGNRFFDHYDLVCLEDRDFYPDGRDLGENYTLTGWLMNPCAQSGMLDCMHCHTSSGRYRFKEENPNGACQPCHAQRVRRAQDHTRHPDGDGAPQCIDCHMPMTEFSRMLRSDHSIRPPSPDAGVRFGSPVACIICHSNETPQWAAAQVREWHPDSKWQREILRQGELVDAARRQKWEELPDILDYITEPGADPVVVTSLIRLLESCPDARKWNAIRRSATHELPLVRGAAVRALADDLQSLASRAAIIGALADDYRLVRVHAASSLASLPREHLPAEHRDLLDTAETELLASFSALPDTWSSHYNLGIYRSQRGEVEAALAAYKRSIALRSDVIMPYVNASIAASRLGRLQESIDYLQTAHELDPTHAAVSFNLGLALAERRDIAGAEKHLRIALKDADSRARAAYNLAVLVAERDLNEAVSLCAIAAEAAPDDPRNAFTQAFYLRNAKRHEEAIAVLAALIEQHRGYADAWMLLGNCYLGAGRREDAAAHYRTMMSERALQPAMRTAARNRLAELQKQDQ